MNIAIFKLNKTPEYLISVNGAEYMTDPTALEGNVAPNSPDVIFNPNITAVKNVPVLTALIKVLNTKLPANKQITKQELVDALKGEII